MKRFIVPLLVIVAAYALLPRLFTADSTNSILLWLPLVLTVALGEFLVVVAGGIDISVGSIMGFSSMTVGIVFKANPSMPLPLAILVAVVCGLILGLINGALVARAKLPPLIVTIGTLATFRGLAFLIAKGETITGSYVPDSFTKLSNHGIPLGEVTLNWLAITSILCTAAFLWFTTNTALGRSIFAFGGQPEGALRRGIAATRIQTTVYALSGAMAGLGGAMYLSRFGQAQPGSAGSGFELTVIATVAIAGTKLTGGAGSIGKLVVAAIGVSALNVALSIQGISDDWQTLVYGSVLLVMVCADSFRRRSEVVV